MPREPMSDQLADQRIKIGELELEISRLQQENARLHAIMLVLKSALEMAEQSS
jgi:hypothetical protein